MEEASKNFEKRLSDFYNDEIPWTSHVHHGYCDEGATATTIDQEASLIRMVDQILQFANVPVEASKKPKTIVDVGCGFGGVTFQLGEKYGAKCLGINIIPRHIEMATEVAIARGLGDQFKFQVSDALQLPLPDKQFDLVWSLECGEHIQDKAKFVSELVRVAAPGGTIIVAGNLIRGLAKESLKAEEKEQLQKFDEVIPFSKLISCGDYVDLFQSHSVTNLKYADWTKHAFVPDIEEFGEHAKLGNYFREAHKMGLLKYTVMTCTKL